MFLHLILPIIAFSIAQGIKFILKTRKQKKFNWRNIFSYSDMPSGHTAVVVSLTTITGLIEGIDTALFAITFVFSAIVITDAIGFRNYLGQHGKTLNLLVNDLEEDDFLDDTYPELLEKIGHTPIQAIVGAFIGFIVSIVGWLIFY
jgi:uncharacterized protein